MAGKVGIFIRSTKSFDDIIEACNNLMRNSKSKGKILSIRQDETYGGLKVYFNGDGIVQELLRKQFLYETGDLSTIHPLVTHLIVQDAIFTTTEEEFTKKLRNVFQSALGPVLEISKVPISKLHPDIGNGNWRVLLDVPEIEDLDVYKKVGLPDQFEIVVPGEHGRLPVIFYCTKCEKDGHTQWRCNKTIKEEAKPISQSLEDSLHPKMPTSGFFIRNREEESTENDAAPKNKPMLNRKNIREFESEIGKEEVRNYCDSFPLKKGSEIRRKVGESMKRPILPEKVDRDVKSKKIRTSSMVDDDSQFENIPKASSTTNDADSPEIIYDFSPSIPLKSQPQQSTSIGGLHTRNNVDDSVSTSNQPVPTVDIIKSELPSTDENDSDSNQTSSAPKPIRQRKKPAQGIPIVIPDRIKSIISEIEDGVLNVEQLTAFFNHVKKKSKPCNFAEMYTTDVAGLKKQLCEIKRRYYMIPERGTNVEIQFMKWFVNTLDRFDGTPSTRKRKAST